MASRDPARGFVPITTLDSWLRCAHHDTAVDLESEEVTLAWEDPPVSNVWAADRTPEPAGLAFDPAGCLYHGDLERAQVERVAWRPGTRDVDAVDLLVRPEPAAGSSGFVPAEPDPWLQLRPWALAVDDDQYLYVLDGGRDSIHLLDLVDRRVVRTLSLAWPAVDLAGEGTRVLVATAHPDHPIVELDRSGHHRDVPIPPAAIAGVPPAARIIRVAAGPGGRRWAVFSDGVGTWAIPVADERRREPVAAPGATDIELDGTAALVVAGPPDANLRRFVFSTLGDAEDAPLRARDYDGRGIVRTPEGVIGFWTGSGFRLALEARRQFLPRGHVDCFRLDGQSYQQQWGRVFVEACVPRGTRLQVGFATADDEPDILDAEGASIPRIVPANLQPDAGDLPPAFPPLIASGRVPVVATPWALHRRETGSEVPWTVREPDDRFEVYEVPVQAPPGRYLWLRLTLEGTTRTTPRVRAIRAEYPGHDLLRRLPRTYSRDPVAASFLQRYLGISAGVLTDVEGRATARDLLLDPWGAPVEVLPWLASLVGLTLDDRWPETARRTMLAEAICLFRRRGTPAGLQRMLEIYLDGPVVLVEAFRLRGPGGAFASDQPSEEGTANAIVGAGFRVGGEVGEDAEQALSGSMADAFATHAHRFTMIVPRDLDAEQLATVDHLLELHRPAHTIVDVCTAGRGMRVGLGLHVELSSLIGPTSGFASTVIGESRVGPGAVLGRPRAGVRPGGAHVGTDTVVDP